MLRKNLIGLFLISLNLIFNPVVAQKPFVDTVNTSSGELIIHVLGHASVLFEFNGLAVYIDPYSKVCDYTGMVKADLILVTHGNADHFDTTAIGKIKQSNTLVIYPQVCADAQIYTGNDTVMANGDSVFIMGLAIHAVPAYNLIKTQHPKGVGNGYVILFGNRSVYLSGDTEKIPEMDDLSRIDVAFLPLSQPYNMTAEQLTETAALINPAILIPYHYDNTDLTSLLDLLKDYPAIEVLTGQPVTTAIAADQNVNSGISIYPDPVTNHFVLQSSAPVDRIEIFNVQGKLLKSIEGSGKLIVEIPVQGIPAGTLFIRIFCSREIYFSKMAIHNNE
jgi:L-ascorbate metabolism protein UlaG (beta-lactamase superfamily)